jgi:tRNA (cytidine56-2'-O)-methyltransferase
MEVRILRLDHRIIRDSRTSTHLLLVARAFGANGVLYTGRVDKALEERVKKVVDDWGGSFKMKFCNDWKSAVKEWKGKGGEIIHLTMYGLPIHKVIEKIRLSQKPKLVVVGGAKVPSEMYELANWNVSITSQPHSEIAALSVFLHEFFEGKELIKDFDGAKLKIVPQKQGKKIIED